MTTITTNPDRQLNASAAPRIQSIQYLRAVAALCVVSLHASIRVKGALPDSAVAVLEIGHWGVDLFFVISGFIMWRIGRDTKLSPVQFFMRRAIRVAPMYWIATSVWCLLLIVTGASWIVITSDHFLRSIFFVPHWNPTFPDQFWPVLIPGWTLIFEMFFYAIFASTLLTKNGNRRLVILVSVLLALAGLGLFVEARTAVMTAYTSPLILEFLFGCLIAETWRRGRIAETIAIVALVIGGAILVVAGHQVTADQVSWSRPLIFGTSAALILIGAIGLEHRIPQSSLLEALGDASYSIYLSHLLVLLPLLEVWHRLPIDDALVYAISYISTSLVLASIFGLIAHLYVEKPLQKLLTNSELVHLKRKKSGS